VAESDAAGIYVISVTTTPKAWRKTRALASGKRRIRTALGLHPQLAHERSGELALFEALLPEARYVGEVGLDGSPGYAGHADIQRLVFERVLRLAGEHGGRILTIHSRRAVDDVLESLGKWPEAGVPVLHWFSGTERQLRKAIAQGCWFSVGPPMLRSAKGRRLVSLMPQDRVLTETDGPFATENERPLRPIDAWTAVEQLATLWRISREQASKRLKDNLRTIVTRIPDLGP
jgi:TatD DNase family protein